MARTKDELIKFVANVANKTVTGNTIGEVLEHANLQYVTVNMAVSVVGADGEAVDSPTIVLKKGTTVGSGDTVSAEDDGTYNVLYGQYNVSASKTGYSTKTAVINVDYSDAKAETKEVSLLLQLLAILKFTVKNEEGQAVATPAITLKKGTTVGSGDTVSAEADESYKVDVGSYNYSISADSYVTKTGVVEIKVSDLDGTKTVEVVLEAAG